MHLAILRAVRFALRLFAATGMLSFMALSAFSVLGSARLFFAAEMAEIFDKGAAAEPEALLSVAGRAPRHLVAAALVLIWTTR